MIINFKLKQAKPDNLVPFFWKPNNGSTTFYTNDFQPKQSHLTNKSVYQKSFISN